MTFDDSPEAREEIDRLLDPDDPVLLESDRNRTKGTLTDITRITSVDPCDDPGGEEVRS